MYLYDVHTHGEVNFKHYTSFDKSLFLHELFIYDVSRVVTCW